jgi:hypothetical protein
MLFQFIIKSGFKIKGAFSGGSGFALFHGMYNIVALAMRKLRAPV